MEDRENAIWHEIHNTYRTRRIPAGQLSGIEQTDNGKTIAIADYKGFRIVIPVKEIMINLSRTPSGQEYADMMLRQNKILGNMLKKRQIFYLDTDASGLFLIFAKKIDILLYLCYSKISEIKKRDLYENCK